MIDHIEIENFKSLQKVSLDLGPLNIFVGTNASGKTNFLEALRVLQGIGYGFTADEIFNGKPKGANSEVWEGVRGGSNYAETFGRTGGNIDFRVRTTAVTGAAPVNYAITFTISPTDARVYSERINGETIDGIPFGKRPSLKGSADLAEHFANMQMLRPSSAIQREYSALPFATRMGEHGENFAALVRSILSNVATASAYTSWLKELTPAELDDVQVLTGAMKDPLFAFRLRGEDYPAPILSDGTLRFAAIAAAFFQPDSPNLLLLEEIEEGIHPTRLQLLMGFSSRKPARALSK
jgi:predicted ATPase